MLTCSCYADGKSFEPASGDYFDSENPLSVETRAQIPRRNEKDANIAMQAAGRAHRDGPGRLMNPAERLAVIETRDNGKRRGDLQPGPGGDSSTAREFPAAF